ncbi:hypothetical protein [Glutamicibacter arilaitensis]|uniref:hypothetical protein n=1 Tax=Glutamicibacter arilaitensis TaxID=256701 RepID=UPI003F92DE09
MDNINPSSDELLQLAKRVRELAGMLIQFSLGLEIEEAGEQLQVNYTLDAYDLIVAQPHLLGYRERQVFAYRFNEESVAP